VSTQTVEERLLAVEAAYAKIVADVKNFGAKVAEFEKVHVSRRGVAGPAGERGPQGSSGIQGVKGDTGATGPGYVPSVIEALENKLNDAKAVSKARLVLGDHAGAIQALEVAEQAQKELAAQSI
jgi:hypothetical protein